MIETDLRDRKSNCVAKHFSVGKYYGTMTELSQTERRQKRGKFWEIDREREKKDGGIKMRLQLKNPLVHLT